MADRQVEVVGWACAAEPSEVQSEVITSHMSCVRSSGFNLIFFFSKILSGEAFMSVYDNF